MNWKEFFKPSKWKFIIIGVFILLFIILGLGLNNITCIRQCPASMTCVGHTTLEKFICTFSLGLLLIFGWIVPLLGGSNDIIEFLSIILNLIYIYVISCVIYWVIKRFKK